MTKRFVPETLRVSAPRDGKPCPQASALRLCSPPLRCALFASLQGWAIPLGLPLLPPLSPARASRVFRPETPQFHSRDDPDQNAKRNPET